MYPTIKENELVFRAPNFLKDELKYGDIVIVEPYEESHRKLIKRLVGMPGDTIEIKNGLLYRNGEYVEENYLDEEYVSNFEKNNNIRFNRKIEKIELGEDEYYVLGDNRPESIDSRTFGPISGSKIVYKNIYY